MGGNRISGHGNGTNNFVSDETSSKAKGTGSKRAQSEDYDLRNIKALKSGNGNGNITRTSITTQELADICTCLDEDLSKKEIYSLFLNGKGTTIQQTPKIQSIRIPHPQGPNGRLVEVLAEFEKNSPQIKAIWDKEPAVKKVATVPENSTVSEATVEHFYIGFYESKNKAKNKESGIQNMKPLFGRWHTALLDTGVSAEKQQTTLQKPLDQATGQDRIRAFLKWLVNEAETKTAPNDVFSLSKNNKGKEERNLLSYTFQPELPNQKKGDKVEILVLYDKSSQVENMRIIPFCSQIDSDKERERQVQAMLTETREKLPVSELEQGEPGDSITSDADSDLDLEEDPNFLLAAANIALCFLNSTEKDRYTQSMEAEYFDERITVTFDGENLSTMEIARDNLDEEETSSHSLPKNSTSQNNPHFLRNQKPNPKPK